jgi:hypothetical protein
MKKMKKKISSNEKFKKILDINKRYIDALYTVLKHKYSLFLFYSYLNTELSIWSIGSLVIKSYLSLKGKEKFCKFIDLLFPKNKKGKGIKEAYTIVYK